MDKLPPQSLLDKYLDTYLLVVVQYKEGYMVFKSYPEYFNF